MSLTPTQRLFIGLALLPATALANTADDAIDKANNPLNLAASFAVQDYYIPKIEGSDNHTNDVLFRATIPVASNDVIPVPQIVRVTAPMATRPQMQGGYDTGLGDVSLFDLFLVKQDGIKLGIGPLLTANSASQDEFGTGQWQAGLSGVAINTSPRWLSGALVQWQKSFAGDDDRRHVETTTLQPFLIYKMSGGWFLRSTGIWTYNVQNDDYYIPVGLGAGRAMKVGKHIINGFIEPQWTVAHRGDYQPELTLYAGFSIMLN